MNKRAHLRLIIALELGIIALICEYVPLRVRVFRRIDSERKSVGRKLIGDCSWNKP